MAAALSGLAFLYGLFVLPESLRPEHRAPFSWARANPVGVLQLLRSQRELAGLAVSTFLLNFAHRVFTSVFVLYAGHRYGLGTLQVGLLLTVAGGLDLIVQGVLVGPVAARLGDRRTMLLGLGGGALGLLAMALAPTGLLFAAALAPNALWGFAEPTLKSLMSARVGESEQGQLQGANHSIASLAGIAGPVFFGWVYGVSILDLPGLSFGLAAAVLVAAALCSQLGAAPAAARGSQPCAPPGG